MDEKQPTGAPAPAGDRTSASRSSNVPLIVIFVVAGLILLGTFAYAFLMQIPGSMPGMNH